MGYDIDGKCTECKQFHPCSCEIKEAHQELADIEVDEAIARSEQQLNDYLDELEDRDE